MKDKLYLLGLLGLVGIAGVFLGSIALSGFLAFFLLLLLLRSKKSADEIARAKYLALRGTAVFALCAFGGIFLLASLISAWPAAMQGVPYDALLSLLAVSLSIGFAATLVFFCVHLTLGCLLTRKNKGK
jgi:hypothetical protein